MITSLTLADAKPYIGVVHVVLDSSVEDDVDKPERAQQSCTSAFGGLEHTMTLGWEQGLLRREG